MKGGKRARQQRTTATGAYAKLEQTFGRHALIAQAIGVLHWDMSVVMPPAGAKPRAEQIAALKVLAHELLTDPAVGELLDKAELQSAGLNDWQAANLAEMRREWIHAGAVPARLVAAMSRAASECEAVWRTARPEADFAAIRPSLERVVTLTREVGAAKADALGRPVYDALMDLYEPGADASKIVAALEALAADLPEILDAVLARQASRPPPLKPEGPFPVERQRALCRRMARTVGLDFKSARLDESLHPFSGGVADDSRITTRYDENDFTVSMMGVLHEAGHAMYERGLPKAWRNQPVARARGMTIHESQSLLIEMQVARSRDFLEWAAPVIARAFGGKGPAWSADNLHRLATRVRPDFIRVDADEVTYPAHVILRTRLERAMIDGDLAVADLPGAWNEGMTALLHITPPDDRLGCLQDIHWPGGDFGYFPTYTLGAVAAAQLAGAARKADPAIMSAISRGDFKPLMAWLRTHVHSKGSQLSTDDILREATGRPLETTSFRAHLRRRYLDHA